MSFATMLTRALAGAAGGVAGLAAMRAAMSAGSRALDKALPSEPEDKSNGESSTARLGGHLYRRVTGHEPTETARARLSYSVHWGYGLSAAAGYGLFRGPRRGLDATGGLLFGAALWLVGDEILVPLLGLSKPPTQQPLRAHLTPLAGHLAFGLATAAATQALVRLSRR